MHDELLTWKYLLSVQIIPGMCEWSNLPSLLPANYTVDYSTGDMMSFCHNVLIQSSYSRNQTSWNKLEYIFKQKFP